jgi:hypothetical protein
MIINYNNKDITIPKPFDQCFFGSNPLKEMTIHNRFNDEHHQQYKTMQKGLTWFQKNFTDQYYTLLD